MSRSSDRFESIRTKVERAEKHLSELVEINGQFKSVECSLTAQENPDIGISHLSFNLPEPPNDVPTIAGDCLNNLRSSLDYLVWQMVYSNEIAKPSKSNMFPICDSEQAFERQLKAGRLHGVPEQAISQIARLQPYAGEQNRPLSLLSELCNMDKHRDLHYSVSVASDIALSAFRNGENVLNLIVRNDEILNGEIFGGVGFDPVILAGIDIEIRGRASAYIAFRDRQSDFSEALPVVETLGEITEFVKYEVIDALWGFIRKKSA